MRILCDVAAVLLDFLDRHAGAITAIATIFIAAFTIALATSTRRLWRVTLKTAQSITTSERAYVKMSHSPPGVLFTAGGICGVFIQVKNFGRTPARVTDVVLRFKDMDMLKTSPLPSTPDYSGGKELPSHAFLVTGDSFRLVRSRIFDDAKTAILKNGDQRLLILGYVDYIDQFGQRHRGGYGMEYSCIRDLQVSYGTDEAFKERSNLDLITQHGYNYDRPREEGEGNDWNEPVAPRPN